MISTRKSSQKVSTISTRKVGAVDCFMKDLPSYLWCSNCSQSRNRTPAEKVKPCCQPWIYKENSFRFQKKKNCLIQEYLTVELEPLMKNKKQTQPSSIRIDNILLSLVQAVEDINLSNEDYTSVSSMPSLSSETLCDLDSISISSTTSIASMLSERELHSNVFTSSAASVNSSGSSSSIISITENESFIQVIDVQVNKLADEIAFAIALDLNRFPLLLRLIISKKNEIF